MEEKNFVASFPYGHFLTMKQWVRLGYTSAPPLLLKVCSWKRDRARGGSMVRSQDVHLIEPDIIGIFLEALEAFCWRNLPAEGGRQFFCLIPHIASSSGAAMPGNPHFPLPGGTLAAVAAVAALTSIAGVLCDPAQLQSPPLAFILCCDNGTAEGLVLSATLSYFQNSSIGACVFWSQHYDGFGAL